MQTTLNQNTPGNLPNNLPNYAAQKKLQTWLINGAIILILAVMLTPIIVTLAVSFKREQDVLRKPPVLLPCDTPERSFDPSACRFAVEGYERVIAPKPNANALLGFSLTGRMFNIYVPNTLMYAFGSALVVFLLSGMAGYAFSRYRFRGRQFLMIAILAITGIPLLTNLLALYQMAVDLRKAGLPGYDERMFMVMVYTGFNLPFSVWIVKSFFDAIPRELEEASFIDGCTPIQSLIRIVAPLAVPGLMAAALLCFVNVWNEFLAGYLLIAKRDFRPAMFGMYDFLSANIINYQVVAAACILIAAPVIILFLFTRKTFFQAMTEGAVKG
ncbi:MAG: carbohydrate ABC transporter permease [Anaerolineae bacterium]|nr:carbohydrate ABC transporter permease [Anaerolineae bacterium]